MASRYVEIQGVYEEFLEFSGYVLVEEDEDFQLFVKHGQHYVLPKSGLRFLPLDNADAADLACSRRRSVPIPQPAPVPISGPAPGPGRGGRR
jgi:hypothetical protein